MCLRDCTGVNIHTLYTVQGKYIGTVVYRVNIYVFKGLHRVNIHALKGLYTE